jgi:predicted kinase
MSKIIIVTGLTGAGKTTYSNKLQDNKKGCVFSIDHWMTSLFWKDMPENPTMDWFIKNQKWYLSRIERCEVFIRNEIIKLNSLGVPSILDLGFTLQSHRKTYIDLAYNLRANPEIHHLDVPSDLRWKRVQQRNKTMGKTYSMQVSIEMFNYMEESFEEFNPEELSLTVNI